MSKILKRSLKILILSTSLLIISKALGIYLAVIFFKLEVFLSTQTDGIFSIQIYFPEKEATQIATSFSNLFVLSIFTIIIIYLITKFSLSIASIENHHILIKLSNLNLLKWLAKKDNTFLKVFIWIIYLWIITILILIDFLQGYSHYLIPMISFIITIVLSWILIRTLEKGLEKTNPENNSIIY